MSKVVGFARVSTLAQATAGVSLTAQLDHISSYAVANNLQINKFVSSIGSGSKPLAGSDLAIYVVLNRNCHVIVYDVSRLSRNPEDAMEFIRKRIAAGAKFTFINENITIDKFSDLAEQNQVLAYLVNAQNEVLQLSRRIKMAKQYKKNNGAYIGGILPFGIETYVDADGEKMCRPNAFEMNVVKFIYKCRSTNYTANDLNNLMAPITKYNMQEFQIRLYEEKDGDEFERKVNTEMMDYPDIAGLLNEYEVQYRSKPFTAQILKRIRSPENLKQFYEGNVDSLMTKFNQIEITNPVDNLELDFRTGINFGSSSKHDKYDEHAKYDEHDESDYEQPQPKRRRFE